MIYGYIYIYYGYISEDFHTHPPPHKLKDTHLPFFVAFFVLVLTVTKNHHQPPLHTLPADKASKSWFTVRPFWKSMDLGKTQQNLMASKTSGKMMGIHMFWTYSLYIYIYDIIYNITNVCNMYQNNSREYYIPIIWNHAWGDVNYI